MGFGKGLNDKAGKLFYIGSVTISLFYNYSIAIDLLGSIISFYYSYSVASTLLPLLDYDSHPLITKV